MGKEVPTDSKRDSPTDTKYIKSYIKSYYTTVTDCDYTLLRLRLYKLAKRYYLRSVQVIRVDLI